MSPDLKSLRFATPSYVPTEVYFGAGALACLPELLADVTARLGATRVGVITGHIDPAKAWQVEALRALTDYSLVIAENRVSHPTLDSIQDVHAALRDRGVDLIVAIGGGSTLDTAKVVAALLRRPQPLMELLRSKDRLFPAVPLVTVPTTAGPGSEVTSSSTVWDDRSKYKYSLAAPSLYPRVSLIDPDLTASLPAAYVAGTGLDTLSHAVESAWSVNSTEESIPHGLRAVRLVAANLERLIRDPRDREARTQVSLAALEAGLSIAKAQTTISHAISYPLTARWGVHHGHACGLSLGALLAYNGRVRAEDCQDPRGLDHVRAVVDGVLRGLDAPTLETGEEFIRLVTQRIGLRTFDEYDAFDLGVIAADVVHYDRFRNNPRAMGRAELEQMLLRLRNPAGGRATAVAA
jgi:alcohol dehydrogenase class IV